MCEHLTGVRQRTVAQGADDVSGSDFTRKQLSDDPDSAFWASARQSASEVDLDEIRKLATPRWGFRIESHEHRLGRWIFLRRLRCALRKCSRQEELDDIHNPLAALLALVLWQAKIDNVRYVEFFADEERLTFNIQGSDHELPPAPLCALSDICWLLSKLARIREPGGTGHIMLGKTEPIPVLEITRLDNEPRRRVRVSFPRTTKPG
jgi:hypothetical protein